jgi:nicotinamide-nucleotide amidase
MMTAPGVAELASAAGRLGEALRQRGWTLATAESSTGGLIGHAITMVPGSSDYYPGGVISYSNRVKEVELGVPAQLIAEHGAVSAPVARAMAEGVRRRFDAQLGLAVTGIAGPDGGSPAKPVGTHFIAVSSGEQATRVEELHLAHDREGNKLAAALSALELALAEALGAAPWQP